MKRWLYQDGFIASMFVFLLCLFTSENVFAAPTVSSVSGTVSNGSTISISGSGFGATGPNIVIFDDFQKGTNGSVISTATGSAAVNNWTNTGQDGGLPPRYSNLFSHSGNLSMQSDWSDNNSYEGGRWTGVHNLGGARNVYFSWWQYLPTNRVTPGTTGYPGTAGGPNWKIFWLYGQSFPTDDYTSVIMTDSFPTSGGFVTGWLDGSTDRIDLTPSGGYTSTAFVKGVWHRYEFYAVASTTSGSVTLWEASANQPRRQLGTNSGKTADGTWYTLHFPGYGRGDPNSQTYYDDIYVATGTGARARIEIGDALTYNASRNLAVATPTSWSDSSVQATVRQGSFTNGSAYLYVVDSTGAVNASGYPITIGGGGDTTPPTVSLTAPANGATVSGTTTTVSATVSDNSGTVSGVQFRLDGANLGAEDTTSPFSTVWNTTTATNGAHTLIAVARDPSGNTATSSSVAVTVNNASTTPVPCNTVTTSNFSQSTYNSYGAPFDAFATSTMLVNASCTSADPHTIQLTSGVPGDTTRIVYTKGYYYANNSWNQYTGTCTGALNGEWCQGSVSATITDPNLSTASASAPAYFVGMTCSVQGGGWKCGCRDTACSNFYWQVQGAGL